MNCCLIIAALQEGSHVYADAGFAGVSSQLLCALTTEATDVTGLSRDAIIVITVVAVATAVIILLAITTTW